MFRIKERQQFWNLLGFIAFSVFVITSITSDAPNDHFFTYTLLFLVLQRTEKFR